jgi:cell wall-associated NlpC family hydrolase
MTNSFPGRPDRVRRLVVVCVAGALCWFGAAEAAAAAPFPAGDTARVDAPRQDTIGDRIVAAAATEAGKPYVVGGTGPGGFDCSGLAQFAHRQAGITLPRTAGAQRAAVRPVRKTDLRPGDLIFFGSRGYVYHVGIFAGGNKMWAAPEPGKRVQLQRIWTSAFTAGRAW